MKKLFFVLLVSNLVLWLWGKRQELAPELVAVEPGVGIIRLLDETEVSARREEAAAKEAPRPVTLPNDSQEQPAALPVFAGPDRSGEEAVPVESPPVAKNVSDEPTQQESQGEEPMPAVVAALEPTQSAEVPRSDARQDEALPDAAAATRDEEMPMALATQGAEESEAEPVRPGPAASFGEASTPVTVSGPGIVSDEPTPPPPTRDEATSLPERTLPQQSAEAAAVPSVTRSAVQSKSVCEATGPFRDRTAAERHAAALRPPFARVGVREEVAAKPARYWVVAPAAQDADAAYRRGLADAGVQDAWRVKSGPLAGRLSLGSFQVEENARKHVATLGARGIAAELQTVKDQERRWWVDYERPEDIPAPTLSTVGAESPRQVVERRCSRVAAP